MVLSNDLSHALQLWAVYMLVSCDHLMTMLLLVLVLLLCPARTCLLPVAAMRMRRLTGTCWQQLAGPPASAA